MAPVHSVQRHANAVGFRILGQGRLSPLAANRKKEICPLRALACPRCNPAEGRPKFLFGVCAIEGETP
jgi:hypothetical protein